MGWNQTITKKDVEAVFVRYWEACHRLGLIATAPGVEPGPTRWQRSTDRLVLSKGSKTYGNAWRVHFAEADSGALHRPPAGDDYLGFTKSEAFDNLALRAAVLEDVERHQRT